MADRLTMTTDNSEALRALAMAAVVERFAFVSFADGDGHIEPRPDGGFVGWDDYIAVVNALRAASQVPTVERDGAAAFREWMQRQAADGKIGVCEACALPIMAGESYYPDHNSGGELHAACCGPKRESYTDGDGNPLPGNSPIPAPLIRPVAAPAGFAEGREAAAKLIEPKGKRPCDCDRCDCGNYDDAQSVAVWDADKANADAIRALTPAPVTASGAQDSPCSRCNGTKRITTFSEQAWKYEEKDCPKCSRHSRASEGTAPAPASDGEVGQPAQAITVFKDGGWKVWGAIDAAYAHDDGVFVTIPLPALTPEQSNGG